MVNVITVNVAAVDCPTATLSRPETSGGRVCDAKLQKIPTIIVPSAPPHRAAISAKYPDCSDFDMRHIIRAETEHCENTRFTAYNALIFSENRGGVFSEVIFLHIIK